MLVAFGVLFPHRRIQLFFVLDVTMRNAVWIFLGIDVFLMLGDLFSGTGAWVRDFAQFGGALGGYLMILYWRWRPPSFKRKKSPPQHPARALSRQARQALATVGRVSASRSSRFMRSFDSRRDSLRKLHCAALKCSPACARVTRAGRARPLRSATRS